MFKSVFFEFQNKKSERKIKKFNSSSWSTLFGSAHYRLFFDILASKLTAICHPTAISYLENSGCVKKRPCSVFRATKGLSSDKFSPTLNDS